MRTLGRLGCALLLLCLAGCGDDAEASGADSGQPAEDAALDSGSRDAALGTDAAAPVDAATPGLTCEDVVMFGAFDTACSGDDDCVILGGCSGALWVTVGKGDEAEARALHDRLAYCGGSDGPIMEARCQAQRCVVAPSGELCGTFDPSDDAGIP